MNAPPDPPRFGDIRWANACPRGTRSHKLLALFDRAAARDFADVYVLARLFGKDVMVARAKQIDAGFDTKVLADMIATLDRFTDDEVPVPDDSSAAEPLSTQLGVRSLQRKRRQTTSLPTAHSVPGRASNRRSARPPNRQGDRPAPTPNRVFCVDAIPGMTSGSAE